MTRDEMLDRLEALTPNADNQALETCLEEAEEAFMAECRRDDVPEAARGVIVRMAQRLYAQIGAAGVSAQSFSGASETFLTDWPEDLKRAIHRWRRVTLA